MIHPDTRIYFISDAVGVGVVAKKLIPQGTLVWVRDPLDRELSAEEVASLPQVTRDFSLTYMYRNALGKYVLLWDHGKYVNHSFNSNCMPTPYGFDIALRDIQAGEELTEDYGLLNIIEDFKPEPEGSLQNRGVVRGDDLARMAPQWDLLLAPALKRIPLVEQPLWALCPSEIAHEILDVAQGIAHAKPLASMLLR